MRSPPDPASEPTKRVSRPENDIFCGINITSMPCVFVPLTFLDEDGLMGHGGVPESDRELEFRGSQALSFPRETFFELSNA